MDSTRTGYWSWYGFDFGSVWQLILNMLPMTLALIEDSEVMFFLGPDLVEEASKESEFHTV